MSAPTPVPLGTRHRVGVLSQASDGPSRVRTVLVSGAGVAGLTVAHWLQRFGFDVTVIESAPAPRQGGQAIDVRGPALEVVDRMGIGDAVGAARTRMRGMSVIDPSDGSELMSSTTATLTGGPLDSPDVEMLRDDLAAVLLSSLDLGPSDGRSSVRLHHGTRIERLVQRGDGVDVTLTGGEVVHADLVIGADGLHSGVRRLAFPEAAVGRLDLGTHLSVFTMPNIFDLHEWQVFAARGPLMCGAYTARKDTEVRVTMGYRGTADYRYDDLDAQRAAIASAFADFGWWTPQMLDGMGRAEDFYLAPMVQILMDSWSRGRVVLLGDAAWCTTPLSGQGTSLAIVGAYVLAGELAAADGDVARALAGFETLMRPFVAANQHLALVNEQRSRAMFGLQDPDAPALLDDADPGMPMADVGTTATERSGEGGSIDPESGIQDHWVATAATAIELPDYPDPAPIVGGGALVP